MRKILHDHSERFEILGRDEYVLKFGDIPAAVEFLRRFADDPAQMAILRGAVADSLHDVHRLDATEALKQVAAMLVSGRLKIIRSRHFMGGSGGDEAAEEPKRQAGSAPPATARNASWIEIYLRDTEGQPVPGTRYQITLPDGSVKQGTLDEFGHAEYYGIDPGTCAVTFPDLDADAWERA